MVVIQKIGGYTRVIGPSMENSRFNVSDAFDGTGTYNVAIRLDNNEEYYYWSSANVRVEGGANVGFW